MPFARLAKNYFASASDLKSFGDTFVSFVHAVLKKVINLTVSIQSIKLNKEFNHKLIALGSFRKKTKPRIRLPQSQRVIEKFYDTASKIV